MRQCRLLSLLLLAGLLAGHALQAQTVYEGRGPNGPVFSDRPMPGAKAIELPPLNVIESPKAAAQTPREPPAADPPDRPAAAPAPAYRSLSILFPENDGGIVSASATFEIRVAVDPPLQIGEGHYFSASVDGRAVGRRFTATEFALPQEFWGDAPPPANQRHQLDVSVLDRTGRVLKQAEPVRFALRAPVYPLQKIRPRHPPRIDSRPRKPLDEEAPPDAAPNPPRQSAPSRVLPGREAGNTAILR